MHSNAGTYVTCNTLMKLSVYDNIMRFDSDDIMKPNMIDVVMNNIPNYDYLLCRHSSFSAAVPIESSQISTAVSPGQFLIKRKILETLGGFRNWICAGDSEFNRRVYLSGLRILILDDVLYYKRCHESSLSESKETGKFSQIRNQYCKEIDSIVYGSDMYVNPMTNTYDIIKAS